MLHNGPVALHIYFAIIMLLARNCVGQQGSWDVSILELQILGLHAGLFGELISVAIGDKTAENYTDYPKHLLRQKLVNNLVRFFALRNKIALPTYLLRRFLEVILEDKWEGYINAKITSKIDLTSESKNNIQGHILPQRFLGYRWELNEQSCRYKTRRKTRPSTKP